MYMKLNLNKRLNKMKTDYIKDLQKRELKKEARKRDLRRKIKNGYFDRID